MAMTSNRRTSSSTSHFFAGLGSGVLSAVLLQPADLLKTRVQQSGSSSLWTVLGDISRGPLPIRQLWRGTLPSTLRTGIGSALYFSALNALRQTVARSSETFDVTATIVPVGEHQDGIAPTELKTTILPSSSSSSSLSSSSLPKLSNLANLTTGAFARGSVGFVMMPITILKVRYESNLYTYRSLWSACSDILRREGIRGFFAGFGATAVRDMPYAGLYVLFYEQSKKRLSRLMQSTDPTFTPRSSLSSSSSSSSIDHSIRRSATVNFVSGAMAASVATAVTNPFDAIKTRIQLLPNQYRNIFHAGRRMIQHDGFRSLFDGLALRMTRKALSSALAWTLYEEVIRRVEIMPFSWFRS